MKIILKAINKYQTVLNEMRMRHMITGANTGYGTSCF
jgi:hypothetical protein